MLYLKRSIAIQLAFRRPVTSVNCVKCLRLNLFMYFATTLQKLLTKVILFRYRTHLIHLPRERWVETFAACSM